MELNGLLKHKVILVMLLFVKWRPVLLAPIQDCNSTLARAQKQASLVGKEAKQLLDKYEEFFTQLNDSNVDSFPNASIPGNSTSEMLQSIRTKFKVFQWHLLKVEGYLGRGAEPVTELLNIVKHRLDNFNKQIEELLKFLDPELTLPTVAAPTQLPHDGDFAKMRYGWGVISSLKRLSEKVQEELSGMKACVCDAHAAGAER